jgi:hypothetical protein
MCSGPASGVNTSVARSSNASACFERVLAHQVERRRLHRREDGVGRGRRSIELRPPHSTTRQPSRGVVGHGG